MADSHDDHQEPADFPVAAVAGAIVLIASPFTVLSALGTYLVFKYGRIKLATIFWFFVIPFATLMLIFNEAALTLFSTSWQTTIPGLFDKTIPVASGIFQIFLQQAPIAIPVGVIAGIIYSAHKRRQEPEWVEKMKFRRTPFEVYKQHKTIQDIKADRNSPKDGMTLGVSKEDCKRVVQTYKESRAHTLIVGASGSGKTTTAMSRLRDSIKDGQGAVIIDLKGGTELPEVIAELAERYNKKFTHWLMQPKGEPYTGPAKDGPAYYDAIGRGDATRRKDLLVEARADQQEYYKMESSNYLQILFQVLVANPNKNPGVSTLSDVVQLLDPRALQERAIPLGTNPEYQDVIRSIDALNDEKMDQGKKMAINGLRSQLEELLHSVAGPYLQRDPNGNNNINLKEAAHNGDIVVFSLDSSNYEKLASLVANLIIQDLKTVSSELRRDLSEKPFQVLIDEFQAISSTNIIGLINKSRDANMPVTLTTQALGDLRAVNDAFLDQLIGIISSFVIHAANKFSDAEIFADLTGKVQRKRISESMDVRGGDVIGINTSSVLETVIAPEAIQSLTVGEFIYVNRSSNKVIEVIGIPEDKTKIKISEGDHKKVPSFIKNYAPSLQQSSHVDLSKETPISAPSQFPTPPTMGNKNPILTTAAPVSPLGYDTPVLPPSVEKYGTQIDSATEGVTAKPANRERLKEILNQSPDELLPPSKKKDEFRVSHMPPKVSPPLPSVKPEPQAGSTPRSLPPLPQLPKMGAPAVKPVQNSPLPAPKANKLPTLPPKNNGSFPSLPVKPAKEKESEIVDNKPVKDEFDF